MVVRHVRTMEECVPHPDIHKPDFVNDPDPNNDPNDEMKNHFKGLVSRELMLTKDGNSKPKPLLVAWKCCRTPQHNWAFGVFLHLLSCGPPWNDQPEWCVEFCNSLQMGVQVAPSDWFGSPSDRRKWNELCVSAERLILQSIHSESEFFTDACKEDIEWHWLFDNNHQCPATDADGCEEMFPDPLGWHGSWEVVCPHPFGFKECGSGGHTIGFNVIICDVGK